MANMSYVRFQNTLHDLQDCKDALERMDYIGIGKLSAEELDAAKSLVSLCKAIGKEHQDTVDNAKTS